MIPMLRRRRDFIVGLVLLSAFLLPLPLTKAQPVLPDPGFGEVVGAWEVAISHQVVSGALHTQTASPSGRSQLPLTRSISAFHSPLPSTLAPITATMSYTTYLPLVASRYEPVLRVYLPLIMSRYSSLKPDLTITNVSFDAPNITAGKAFPLSVTVLNQGVGGTAFHGVPSWFYVEVYIKERGFVPAGPPANALDHAGGFCSDASPGCTTGTKRPEHLAQIGTLDAGRSQVTGFTLIFPKAGIYDLYVQVDTTWEGEGFTGKPWGQHIESNEANNILAVKDLYVPASH